MDLHLGPLTVHDADVSLTDYALAVETLGFAIRLWLRPAKAGPFTQHARVLFALLSLTSVLGGTFHGFFPGNTGTGLGLAMWIGTLLSLGLTAVQLWFLAACIALRPLAARMLGAVVVLAFTAYGYVVIAIDDRFLVGILFYLPSTLALLFVCLWKLVTTRKPAFAFGTLALSLNLLGAALQQKGVGIQALHLSHNAHFHVIEAVVFALLYGMFLRVRISDLRSVRARR